MTKKKIPVVGGGSYHLQQKSGLNLKEQSSSLTSFCMILLLYKEYNTKANQELHCWYYN